MLSATGAPCQASPFLSGACDEVMRSPFRTMHLRACCSVLHGPHSSSSRTLAVRVLTVSRRWSAVDPVPPAEDSVSLDQLQATLMDESADMFDRYRAMFALRNRAGKKLTEILVRIARERCRRMHANDAI